MGAGLSNSLERRAKLYYEEGINDKVIAKDCSGIEQLEGSSVNTKLMAPTISNIGIIHQETKNPREKAHQASAFNENKDDPPTVRGGSVFEGGILNNAQGVHIEGSATLISAQQYTNIHNIIMQPDVSDEQDAELFKKILLWISDINYHAIQADNYGKRAPGTGEWALEDPVIVKWLEGALGILWGIGMLGAGKTILSSIIINHLAQKAKANKRICVAFAFSRYTDALTGGEVLAGLLRQVVQDHPCTLPFVKPMYEYHLLHGTRPSQAEVYGALRAIFDSDLFDEKFCALDGLDEALLDTQVDVLDALSELPENFLVMSRPLPLLKERVPEATFIDIIVHDADIEQLIEEKLRRLKTLRILLEKDGWKEKVLKAVLEKSSGMFLLASLQLDMLGGCMHVKDLRAALDALPMGVNAMYQITMERIEGRPGSDLADRALTWLVHARESLNMDDLLYALTVDPATFAYGPDLLVDPETLLSVCCGLITFESKTSLVRLVHYTARDFLVTYLSKTGVDVQATLACTCVARLRSCGFEDYQGDNSYSYLYDDFKTHPFLAYAYYNWAAHAQASEIPSFVEAFVLRCRSFPWMLPGAISYYESLSSVQLAAACDLHGLLARWLGSDRSPLSRALPRSVALDVNAKSAQGYTALALAVIHGNVATVPLLITAEGVDIGCVDSHGWTPLIEASYRGHARIVDVLLGVVGVEHVNAGSCTALMAASEEGHVEVVRSLLRVKGIKVNAREDTGRGEGGGSALTLAALHGRLGAVQLLLGVEGVDVNVVHWRTGTGLAQACRRGYANIVRLFLQRKDVDVNLARCDWGTALMQASCKGRKDVVEMLLERDDVDVNAARPDGHTARSLALKLGHGEISELLQRHGAF
ncbi:hypothetical protein FA15DRAFT_628956 [Coprinopsis marcescibilis]|uniref:Uncharacterized protein n=1 Tax=Coprinopsis marcescibilis TaxID=230819 RepID=A0A5C3KBS6_COPMA|nr:hypothetical protein FA15DRAFT_628956 [Coprinopsis marcescibilis]